MSVVTQKDNEDRMFFGGVERARIAHTASDTGGRAPDTPYGREIVRDFVIPLTEVLLAKVADSNRAGRGVAAFRFIKHCDMGAIAMLSVRNVISSCAMSVASATDNKASLVATAIGRTVYREQVAGQLADEHPELFRYLCRDFARRMSKSETHRYANLRKAALDRGMDVVEWPVGVTEQVGMLILEMLTELGMIVINKVPMQARRGVQTITRLVALHPEVEERVQTVKSYIEVASPLFLPCIEPPIPWTSMYDGGFHTKRMRRATRGILTTRLPVVVDAMYEAPPEKFLRAANTLQSTQWKVNKRILSTAVLVARAGGVGDVVNAVYPPKPEPLADLAGVEKDQMTEEQLTRLKAWKNKVRDWHTEIKAMTAKVARMQRALRVARDYEEYPNLYFVYAADTRGRLYPKTQGLNPQGGDLEKALLHFSNGHPITNAEQEMWFFVHGANKFGFDKAPLSERANWVRDRHDLICTFADDPVHNRGWADADNPWQFLAWCFEYQKYTEDPGSFRTHIPVSMDGSCNGLQNLSAMLRDEIGGAATNLVPSKEMQDIYKLVAVETAKRLGCAEYRLPEKQRLRDAWLAHGINRAVCKRAVMCTPYGVTRLSATDYVISDYLLKHHIPGIARSDFKEAALLLMEHMWPAIGDVVVKGRQAMAWMGRLGHAIVKHHPEDVISWKTPTDFIAFQAYYENKSHRINTSLFGTYSIKIFSSAPEADARRHSTALAPNFVHSMDAAHLHLTTNACADAGITDLAMIHDDYGTHASFAPVLYRKIRESFVSMYMNNDPIQDLYDKYPYVAPPSKGTMDISDVSESQFFFS